MAFRADFHSFRGYASISARRSLAGFNSNSSRKAEGFPPCAAAKPREPSFVDNEHDKPRSATLIKPIASESSPAVTTPHPPTAAGRASPGHPRYGLYASRYGCAPNHRTANRRLERPAESAANKATGRRPPARRWIDLCRRPVRSTSTSGVIPATKAIVVIRIGRSRSRLA